MARATTKTNSGDKKTGADDIAADAGVKKTIARKASVPKADAAAPAKAPAKKAAPKSLVNDVKTAVVAEAPKAVKKTAAAKAAPAKTAPAKAAGANAAVA